MPSVAVPPKQNLNVRFSVCAGDSVMVPVTSVVAPAAPSAPELAPKLTDSVCATAFTASENALSLACGSAPPPTLVPKLATSKPLVPVPSGPSATSIVLPTAEAFAVSSSVAVCTVLVACPVNVTRGVAVVRFASVTPVFSPLPALAASDQSASATPVPPTASGTTITSPATSLRLKLTVNASFSPGARPPPSSRASDTTVALASVIATSTCVGEPALTLAAGSVPKAIRTVSLASSSASASAVSVTVPLVAPWAMVTLPASV